MWGGNGRGGTHFSEQSYFESKVKSPPGLNHCPKSLSKFRSPGSCLNNVCSNSPMFMSHDKSVKPGIADCGKSIRPEVASVPREGGAPGVAGARFVGGP